MTTTEWRRNIHARHLREQREADAALRRPAQRGQGGAERGTGALMGVGVGACATATGNGAESAADEGDEMSDMDERVAKVAEVLAGHAWLSSDEEKIDGEWTWGLNCECGEFVPGAEADAHFAAVLKPLLAEWQAEDEARAWDEGWDERDNDCSDPYSPHRRNPYRAALDGTTP